MEATEVVFVEPRFELTSGADVEEEAEANNIVLTEPRFDELLRVDGGKGFW